MATILCILAGGRSSRFGSSKLNVRLGGESILAWQLRRLALWHGDIGGCATRHEAWLSAPPRWAPPGGAMYGRCLVDPFPYGGPLPAIVNLLRQAADDDLLAMVPADMPAMAPWHLAALARRLDQTPAATVAMARWNGAPRAGAVEPLPSIWRAAPGRALLEPTIARGQQSIQALATLPQVVCLPLTSDHRPLYLNINHPGDVPILARHMAIRIEPFTERSRFHGRGAA